MDIALIHVGSFATNIAQAAAGRLAALLDEDAVEHESEVWFDRSRPTPDDTELLATELNHRADVLELLGDYVCQHRVDQGERLYRFAVSELLVASIGDWPDLTFMQKQPWETFVSTCRRVFDDLQAAQIGVIEARQQALAEVPPGLTLEDSIFEKEEGFGDLRPEAVDALRQFDSYQRSHAQELQAARVKITQLLADRATFNGADPSKFDHDGDGIPGGAKKTAAEKSIERHQRKQTTPPAAAPGPVLSVGEPPPRPPVNRGGRGRKKTA